MAGSDDKRREQRREDIDEQRKRLPDQPGVYMFSDGDGRVVYVGKSLSIRKRVASHFSSPLDPRQPRRRDRVDRLPRHRDRGRGADRRAAVHQAPPADPQRQAPRRQVLPLHRDQPRRGVPAGLLHPRAPPPEPRLLRPLRERAPGPRDARAARQAVPVPDLRRRRARSPLRRPLPRLLHQALRGALRRLRRRRGVRPQHRRDPPLPLRPLPRRRARPRARRWTRPRRRRSSSGRRCSATALAAVRSLMERQRVAGEQVGTADLIGVAVEGAGGQRPGLPGPRRRPRRAPGLLPRQQGRATTSARSPSSSSPSTTRPRRRCRRSSSSGRELAGRTALLAEALGERRGTTRRGARRRARRQAPPARARRAQRPPRARPGEAAPRAPPPRAHRGARRARRARSGWTRSPIRIEGYDISNLGPEHTVASMVVFEGGAPKKSDYRRFNIRGVEGTLRRLRLDGRGPDAAPRPLPGARASARPTTPSSTRASRRCPG